MGNKSKSSSSTLAPVPAQQAQPEIGKPRETKRRDADEDIDASAEEFIKSFKENLLLQRLQSIENYKQMLARGV